MLQPNSLRSTIAVAMVAGLSVIAYAYGFLTSEIGRDVWTETGRVRLLMLVVAYTLLAAALIWRHAAWLTPAILLLASVWAIVAVGPVPLLAVGLLIFSAWQLGLLLLPERRHAGLLDDLLATLLGMAVLSFLQGLLVRFPVHSVQSTLVLLSLPLLFRRRRLLESARVLTAYVGSSRRPDRRQQAAFALAGLPALCHWVVALNPEFGVDALAMHLRIPSVVARIGFWAFDPREASWALMPMGANWLHTPVFLLGGDAAVRLLNVAFALIIGLLVYVGARSVVSQFDSGLLAALFLSTPLVHLLSGSVYVEHYWTAMVVGSFLVVSRLWEAPRAADAYLFAVLAGSAVAAKVGAIGFAVPLGVLAAIALARGRGRSGVRIPSVVAAGGLMLIFASPPYATSFLMTGNPLFPFFDDLFPTSVVESIPVLRDVRFERPLTWTILWDLTFHTDRYIEAGPGVAGLQYLFLVPFSTLAFLARGMRQRGTALAVALAAFGIVFASQSNIRYTYPAMVLLTIAAAPALAWVRQSCRPGARIVVPVALCVLAGNIYLFGSAGTAYQDFWLNPFSQEERVAFVERHAPVRLLEEHLNQVDPGRAAIVIGSNHIADLDGPAFTSTWHHHAIADRLQKAPSIASLLEVTHDYDVRYLIVPVGGGRHREPAGPDPFRPPGDRRGCGSWSVRPGSDPAPVRGGGGDRRGGIHSGRCRRRGDAGGCGRGCLGAHRGPRSARQLQSGPRLRGTVDPQ